MSGDRSVRLSEQSLLQWTNLFALWLAASASLAPFFAAFLPADMLRSVTRTEAWFGVTMLAFVLALKALEASGLGLQAARGLLAMLVPVSAVMWLTAFYGFPPGKEAIRGGFLLFLFLVVLWWKAISIAQWENFYKTTEQEFVSGLLVLLAGGAILAWKGLGTILANVLLFIVGSLVALSVAKLLEESAAEKYAVQLFGFRHALAILAASLTVLATGAALSLVYSLKLFELAWGLSGGALRLLARGLKSILFLILPAIFAPFVLLSKKVHFGLPTPSQLEEPLPAATPTPIHHGFLPSISWLMPYLIAAFLVGFVLFFLAMLLRRKPEGPPSEAMAVKEEMRADASAPGNLFGSISGLFDAVRNLGRRRGFLDAASIQNIYANLQRAAARKGYPRSPWETPYEYLPKLRQAFPEHVRDVEAITDAYVLAYYGRKRLPAETVESARELWRRIEKS